MPGASSGPPHIRAGHAFLRVTVQVCGSGKRRRHLARCLRAPTSYASASQATNSSSTSAGEVSRKACTTLRGEYVSTRRKRGLSIRRGGAGSRPSKGAGGKREG